ncbi:MAG: fibronectin type III domain-containing protein, partial [Lysobacterales bacterium]
PGAAGVSDRDSLLLCTFNAGSTGPITINLNADGIALVQSWIANGAANKGIIIADSVTSNGADFDSSESSTAMSRPRLEVTYTVPANPDNPPDAPTGLAAAVFSSDRIDLNWSDNSGVETGFKVERSPNGTDTWTEIVDLPADSTTYQNGALAAGTTYYYRVFAYNDNGVSGNSNTANATTFTVPRSIQFSGRAWMVKASGSPVGPGPNYFSDTADDVWVDGSGYLHLRIAVSDGNWHSSEVITDDVLGYGTYTFTLGSRIDLLDRNIVVGLFTWDSFAPEFNYREIDIEFARWGDPSTDNSQYVVQPWDNPGNTFRWETTLTGNDSTHAFTWRPDQLEFSSHQGSPPAAVIQSWTYNGPDVPPEGTTSGNARINFWLFGGSAPFDGQEAELVIKSFDFTLL